MQELHTKYRPQTWEAVLGQDKAVDSLRKALKAKRGRAFILTGPSGTGKTTLGRIIAREVGCTPGNLMEVDGASSTGIDEMRRVSEALLYSGLGGSATKVAIIDEAHMLSKAAWNSLLKSIEEPPPHVYWVFCTTEAAKIPVTIRGRCISYDLKAVSEGVIRMLLHQVCKAEKLETPDAVLELISEQCGGSPRQALVGLSKCAECKGPKAAAALLATVWDNAEVIEFIRLLVKGADWAGYVAALAPFRELEGEGIRLIAVGYLTSCLLGCKDGGRAARLLNILDAFSTPYPSGAKIYPLLLSVGQILMGDS